MSTTAIDFTLYPKQCELWNAWMTDRYTADQLPAENIIAYGGSRGGTKSTVVRWGMLLRRLMLPHTSGLIFRKTNIDLRENHIDKYLDEFPWIAEFYYASQGVIRLPNASRIVFLYGESDREIDRYQGHQYDDVCIDEASECTPYMIQKLMATCRRSSPKSPVTVPKTILTFNPGGPSHEYLKRLFVDRDDYRELERKESYKFIQSRMWDNYHLVSDIPRAVRINMRDYFRMTEPARREHFLKYAPYAQQFASMDPYMRAAQVDGDWHSFSGQFFARWNRDIHVIPPFEIPPWWTRLAAIDYGGETAVIVAAISPAKDVYVIGEFYDDNHDLGPAERAHRIADWMIRERFAQTEQDTAKPNYGQITRHVPIVADINLWYPDGSNARRQPVMDFRDAGLTNIRKVYKAAREGTNYRLIANEAIKKLIYWERNDKGEFHVKPKLFVFSGTAPELVRTLPLLRVNPDQPLDFIIEKGDRKRDHAYDALKYLVQNIGQSVPTPVREVPDFSPRRIAPASAQSAVRFDYV